MNGAELLVRPTAAERAAVLPGDDLLEPADVVMDRAFSLDAPPEAVWPWVAQLGKGRGGWYFPGLVERLLPRRGRGLRHVDPALVDLSAGDVVPDWGGRDASFTVAEVQPPSHLLYRSLRGHTEFTWVLHLTPVGPGTRLHLRLRMAPVRHDRIAAVAGGAVDLATIAALAVGLRERVTTRR